MYLTPERAARKTLSVKGNFEKDWVNFIVRIFVRMCGGSGREREREMERWRDAVKCGSSGSRMTNVMNGNQSTYKSIT